MSEVATQYRLKRDYPGSRVFFVRKGHRELHPLRGLMPPEPGGDRDRGQGGATLKRQRLVGECRARYWDSPANLARTYRARDRQGRGESTGLFPTRTLRITPLGVPAWSRVFLGMKSLKVLTSSVETLVRFATIV